MATLRPEQIYAPFAGVSLDTVQVSEALVNNTMEAEPPAENVLGPSHSKLSNTAPCAMWQFLSNFPPSMNPPEPAGCVAHLVQE